MKQEPLKAPTSAELIDELGDLQKQIAAAAPLAKRAAAIRETILGWTKRQKAMATATFEGKRYVAVVGGCQNKRTIKDLGKVFDRLGKKLFLEVCSVPLGAVEEHIPLPERPDYIEESATGPRRLEVMARGRAPADRKK